MDHDYRPVVAGDILAMRGSSWLARGIVRATGGPCSHVGMFVSLEPPVVIEALDRVKTRPLDVSLADAERAWILHDNSITDEQRRAIVDEACSMSAASYGWLDIAAQGIDAALGTTWPTDHMTWFLNQFPICSYLVARAYQKIDLHFGKKAIGSITPADIFAFAQAHPEMFDIQVIQ